MSERGERSMAGMREQYKEILTRHLGHLPQIEADRIDQMGEHEIRYNLEQLERLDRDFQRDGQPDSAFMIEAQKRRHLAR